MIAHVVKNPYVTLNLMSCAEKHLSYSIRASGTQYISSFNKSLILILILYFYLRPGSLNRVFGLKYCIHFCCVPCSMTFVVLEAVRMTLFFWVVTPCRFVGR
jgi:hypothetical protein